MKHEMRRLLRRFRLKWEDNIKMDLYNTGCEGVDWIQLTQDKVL